MSRVMVAGGAGFIGSHLVEALLKQGDEVTILDNLATGKKSNLDAVVKDPKLRWIEKDIRDRDSITDVLKGHEVLYHLAALADIVPSIQRPRDYFETNVDGTFNMMEAARAAKIRRVVYSASSSCYGLAKEIPTTESAAIRPEYPYALTKYLGEQVALHWGKVYGIDVVSLRLFNVYGPRARTSGTYGAVFGVFLAQKIHGKPFTVVGDGTQTRDFTYVSDVVRAFKTAGKSHLKDIILNVGSGCTISVNRIVDILGGEKVHIPKRPGEPDVTFADISLINRELKWKPEVSIDTGVATLVENIKSWSDAPVWTPESIKEATQDWFKYLKQTINDYKEK